MTSAQFGQWLIATVGISDQTVHLKQEHSFTYRAVVMYDRIGREPATVTNLGSPKSHIIWIIKIYLGLID